jgi:di/tricarboxylate transporter
MILTFVILAITIIFFIFGRLRADVVALLSLLTLFLAGIITLDQALSGFGDSTVIMIAALFVIGDGLSRTGVTAWLGERMLRLAGNNKVRLLVVMMAATAILSAFISNTGTVATLMPAVISAAWRIGSVPSKFLMPLAFAANTGGLLTLTGTPPNIIVNQSLLSAGLDGFGYFEFALIGLPLLVAAILYMVLVGRKLLPARKVEERPAGLTESVGELARDYTIESSLYWLRVRYGSRLVGLTLEEAALGRDYNVSVIRIEHPIRVNGRQADQTILKSRGVIESLEKLQTDHVDPVPGPGTKISANDVLLVKGSQDAIDRVMVWFNVGVQKASGADQDLAEMLLSHEVGIAEVLLTPRSAYIGRTVSQGHFAEKFNVQVLNIRRQHKQVEFSQSRLRFGDALLVRGRWKDIELLGNERRNFVVVGSPESMARQVVELNRQAVIASLALISMIILMVTGFVPTVIAALIAAIVMVLGGCLSMEQAYRSVSWSSVILIAAMIPMSIALQVTGGAEFLADALVDSLGSFGPLALMSGVFLLTTALSQVINNSATTVLVSPIVLQAANDLGVSPYPMMMIVAISASTAFLTPIGTTTNLMVSAPGSYSFNDFIKLGLPLVVIFLLLSLALVPMIWPL